MAPAKRNHLFITNYITHVHFLKGNHSSLCVGHTNSSRAWQVTTALKLYMAAYAALLEIWVKISLNPPVVRGPCRVWCVSGVVRVRCGQVGWGQVCSPSPVWASGSRSLCRSACWRARRASRWANTPWPASPAGSAPAPPPPWSPGPPPSSCTWTYLQKEGDTHTHTHTHTVVM